MKKLLFLFLIVGTLGIHGQDSLAIESISPMVQKIDSIVEMGIQKKAFPGAQVFIFKEDSIRLNKSYGFHTYDSLVRVENHHLYDLASVTKVLASTLAFMKLYENYNIDLDQKIASHIPLIKNSNKKNTTFREILSHQAGWLPYIEHQNTVRRKNGKFKFRTLSAVQSRRYPKSLSDSLFIHHKYINKIMRRIKKTPVEKIGEYRYSGLFFFLLPDMVKSLSGQSFDNFLDTQYYKPMGIERLTFNPSFDYPKREIVPTEKDSLFRKTLVQGWVHDEAAALMGGVSGNAGLFSNASSLAKLLQMLLDEGKFEGRQFLKPETVKLFTSRSYPETNNRRGLGFDKPTLGTIPAERYPSEKSAPESFGHSGFTGNLIWVDPVQRCFMVFLSNRVYPTREQKNLYRLSIRGNILDVALQED
jgi:CubicO group peptidase (beta-lactamase class C family)